MSLDMGWERLVGFRKLENATWQPDMAMATYLATLPFCMAQSVNLGIFLNPQVCPQQIVSNGEHGSILVIQTGSILIEHIWRIFEALKIVPPAKIRGMKTHCHLMFTSCHAVF
jgi:hypothetical protein